MLHNKRKTVNLKLFFFVKALTASISANNKPNSEIIIPICCMLAMLGIYPPEI